MLQWTPAIVISLSVGLRQNLGLFMEPIVRGGTVTVATLGFVMAMQNLAWGIGHPSMGALFERYGGRLVVANAAVLCHARLAMTVSGGVLALVSAEGS